MTLTLASNMVSTNKAKALIESMERMSTRQTLRTYSFTTLQGISQLPLRLEVVELTTTTDLHRFQESISGFSVLYDGYVTVHLILGYSF